MSQNASRCVAMATVLATGERVDPADAHYHIENHEPHVTTKTDIMINYSCWYRANGSVQRHCSPRLHCYVTSSCFSCICKVVREIELCREIHLLSFHRFFFFPSASFSVCVLLSFCCTAFSV